jgi:hypothetical protein
MGIKTTTYSFLGDMIRPMPAPPAPAEPAAPAAPELPPTVLMVGAEHVKARCAQLAGLPEFKSHPSGSQPIELARLTVAAHRLRLEAAAFGDARDQAAAAEAEAAAAALEATWLAGTTRPAPVPPVAEMPEPGPVGRPRIGSLVHRWAEADGKCFPAFVEEIYAGPPTSSVAVTVESPYLKLVDAGGGRPQNARWIPKPVRDLTPGMRPPIVSYHRGTPQECPGWSTECPTLRRG